ncbi:9923_t:CDS:2, partial [Ambispora leptoticha]
MEGNHIFKPTWQKEHITRDQLYKIKSGLNLTATDDLLFFVVALVAFYGLARLGELLPGSYDTTKMPTMQALRFDRTGRGSFATIQLPRTKCYNTSEHPTLIINSTKDETCPIHVLKAYIIRRTDPGLTWRDTNITKSGHGITKYTNKNEETVEKSEEVAIASSEEVVLQTEEYPYERIGVGFTEEE